MKDGMKDGDKRTLSVLVGVVVVVVLTATAWQLCPANHPVKRSHLFQVPKDHVVLTRDYHVGGCGMLESEFFRIYPDGTKDSTPYRVPRGRLLVITDVDWWLANFIPPYSPGYSTYFDLALEHQVGALITTFRVFKDTLIDDPQNRLGRSVSMTTGFVVAPDTRICPNAQVPLTNDRDKQRLDVILRGYLIDGTSETASSQPTTPVGDHPAVVK
jgi:hypothetical protein